MHYVNHKESKDNMKYLTVRETYVDDLGVTRYNNVSWPVFLKIEDFYSVKDTDGRRFICPASNAFITGIPSKLSNLSDAEYPIARRTRKITDYDKEYRRFGVEQGLNTRAQHEGGDMDKEAKKRKINERNYSTGQGEQNGQENLLIED